MRVSVCVRVCESESVRVRVCDSECDSESV